MHICKFFCLNLVYSNTFQAFVKHNLVYQLQYSSIKFCSYNFILNKVPNYNDVTSVAISILNEVPNSNDVNNLCLTTVGAQQFSMAAIYSSCRKADLPEMRDNDMIYQFIAYCYLQYVLDVANIYHSTIQTDQGCLTVP